MREPPLPMRGPHWLLGTNNLIVTGGENSALAPEVIYEKNQSYINMVKYSEIIWLLKYVTLCSFLQKEKLSRLLKTK